ncbi:hypothetical protein AX14_002629 [Amanita brunnescens Koide BX004]|nr:hypothetical protein AX14_002629 [Amanita brunnescens Koide BX004]
MLIITSTNTRPKQRTIQRGSGGGRRVSHLERLMGCSATALKRNSLFDLMTLYIFEPGPPELACGRVQLQTTSPIASCPIACKKCYTCITSVNVHLPPSSYPPDSRAFRGFHGKASLFTETYNVKLGRPSVQLMVTGAHTMQEITCSQCSTYLGWKIVRAHEHPERWKEGLCLLELECLHSLDDSIRLGNFHSGSSSDSDSDCSFENVTS